MSELWQKITEVWQHGWFGIDVANIITALFLFFVVLVPGRLIVRLILSRLRRWTERTDTKMDDRLVEAIASPLQALPSIAGFSIALEALTLSGDVDWLASNVVRTLIVVLLFWALYRVVELFSGLIWRLDHVMNSVLADWLGRVAKVLVAMLGAMTVMEIWGINVAALIAGLGLFGVAVALGAQDLFKNLIAGILVILEQRFSPGNWIRVDGVVEGVVESIGFRSTRVRRFDKAPVYVPNAKLSDAAVTNFSAMSHRRIYWRIGLEYRTTVAQLRQVRDGIEALMVNNPDIAQPPEVPLCVRVDRFNDSSIDLLLYCFTRTIVWGEWLEIKERLALGIKHVVEEAGCAFAFPSQSVYVEALPVEGAINGTDRPENIPLQQEGGRPISSSS